MRRVGLQSAQSTVGKAARALHGESLRLITAKDMRGTVQRMMIQNMILMTPQTRQLLMRDL